MADRFHLIKLSYLIKLFVICLVLPELATAKDIHMVMLLWRTETASEVALKQQLATLNYQVKYTIFEAKQDRQALADFIRQRLRPTVAEFDYIYTFGTTISMMVNQSINTSTPQLFAIVTNPVKAGLVNTIDKPVAGTVIGTTNRVPTLIQITNAKKLLNFEKIAFIYNPRENNSIHFLDEIYQLQRAFNFTLYDFRVKPDKANAEKSLTEIIKKINAQDIDTVFLPPDSFLGSQAKLLGKLLNKHQLKSVSSADIFLTNGALLGTVADRTELGRKLATLIDQHQQGTPIAEMKVIGPGNGKLIINSTTATLLNLKLSEESVPEAEFIK